MSCPLLQCDMAGHYYVTSCPGGVIFNTESLECGFVSPGCSPSVQGNSHDSSSQSEDTHVSLPPTVLNPCTTQALAMKKFYHKYLPDKTK